MPRGCGQEAALASGWDLSMQLLVCPHNMASGLVTKEEAALSSVT